MSDPFAVPRIMARLLADFPYPWAAHLRASQRRWLRTALAMQHPGHDWLRVL